MELKTNELLIMAFPQLSGFDTSGCSLVNMFCGYLPGDYPVILPHITNRHRVRRQAVKFKMPVQCHAGRCN